MYLLKKKFTFEAAHQLHNYDGNCSRLHGHSFVGWLIVQGDKLHTNGPKVGMLMDYADLKAAVKPLVDNYLDHHFLNQTTALEDTTSENLAKWVYDQLHQAIPALVAVTIEETCTAICTYWPDKAKAPTTMAAHIDLPIGIIT